MLDNVSLPDEIKKKLPKGVYKWNPAVVPGTIHTDLLNNGIIEDPFYADNELKLVWINGCNWIYRTVFDFYETDGAKRLVFEGLDTAAAINLNGDPLGFAGNMFLRHEFDVTGKLKKKKNKLEIIFFSPVITAKSLEAKYGNLPVALNPERVYLRKAQYSFGWDWGPSFPTSGIWRDVYIEEIPSVVIDRLRFDTLDLSDKKAEVEVDFSLKGNVELIRIVKIRLQHGAVAIEKELVVDRPEKICSGMIVLNPSPWYPNGEGEQPLYKLRIELYQDNGKLICLEERKVGIRKLELRLEEGGKPAFKFVINGKPVFARGFNWIPADSFLPRIEPDKYKTLLEMVKEANANMVRVWGGGVYEPDYFYELCDELGLMVWQDFMFACGAYPEYDQFLESVRKEIVDNVCRIQYHPSLAIWCGNNENEWIWYQSTKTSPVHLPGYNIYHRVIPEILGGIDPNRPYWPSSPFGNDDDPNSQGTGNNHQWNIWSRWIDYNEVSKDNSLFVTEFGLQGPANISTLNSVIPKKNRKTFDPVFEHHNKQIEGTERIFRFMASHLPVKSEWMDFNYLGQLNQALGLKKCIEHWRANMPLTSGTIIWQLNDCWPVTSWAVVDSNLIPKMAYYFTKNAFASRFALIKKENSAIVPVVVNQQGSEFHGKLVLKELNLKDGKEIRSVKAGLNCPPYTKSEMAPLPVRKGGDESDTFFVSYLYNEDGVLIHNNLFYKNEWKHAPLPEVKVGKEIVKLDEGYFLNVRANRPAFFTDFYHQGLEFKERGILVLPGTVLKIKIKGRNPDKVDPAEIKVFTLNDYVNA